MKRYSVAQARKQLASVLNAAERGDGVVIERQGVQFQLTLARPPKRLPNRVSLIEYLDPVLDSGAFGWELKADGLRFKKRAKRP